MRVTDGAPKGSGKAELAGENFKTQDQEWDALLRGHFRNDIK